MLIKNDIHQFSIEILSYEFASYDNEYDANWLQIKIDVKKNDAAFCLQEPCLLRWEVLGIIRFFQNSLDQEFCDSKLEFMEPTISFSIKKLLDSKYLLIAYIYHSDFDHTYQLEFDLRLEEISLLIEDLKNQLLKFEIRS